VFGPPCYLMKAVRLRLRCGDEDLKKRRAGSIRSAPGKRGNLEVFDGNARVGFSSEDPEGLPLPLELL
jgi:hypothetical protein